MTEPATGSAPAYDTANVHLDILGERRLFPLPVRLGESTLFDLLDPCRELTHQAAAVALKQAADKGRSVSCRAGCGACCRQLVAVSTVEAVHLARMVESMPEPRRSVIRGRFAAAIQRLESVGLLKPDHPRGDRYFVAKDLGHPTLTLRGVAARYWAEQIACPFLEEESCGIHPERPLVCREYHVVSPAEECVRLFDSDSRIEKVEPPLHTGDVLSRTAHHLAGSVAGTIPLILILEWAAVHGAEMDRRFDGIEMFTALLGEMDRSHEQPFEQRPDGPAEAAAAPAAEAEPVAAPAAEAEPAAAEAEPSPNAAGPIA
jgi:Fe-S-cluster containining protein